MSKKVCPDCGHDEFFVTAIERHTWRTNSDGDYIDDEGCCEAEIVSDSDWLCTECKSVFSRTDLIDPDEKDDDVDPPDDYDDPKDAYERMTDAEIRYNRGY